MTQECNEFRGAWSAAEMAGLRRRMIERRGLFAAALAGPQRRSLRRTKSPKFQGSPSSHSQDVLQNESAPPFKAVCRPWFEQSQCARLKSRRNEVFHQNNTPTVPGATPNRRLSKWKTSCSVATRKSLTPTSRTTWTMLHTALQLMRFD